MYLHKYKTMLLHDDQSVYLKADPSMYLPDMSKTLVLRLRLRPGVSLILDFPPVSW